MADEMTLCTWRVVEDAKFYSDVPTHLYYRSRSGLAYFMTKSNFTLTVFSLLYFTVYTIVSVVHSTLMFLH